MIKFSQFKNFKEKAVAIVEDEYFKIILNEIFGEISPYIFDNNVKLLTKKDFNSDFKVNMNNKNRMVLIVNNITIDINGNTVSYKVEKNPFIRAGKYSLEKETINTSYTEENQIPSGLWIKKHLQVSYASKRKINTDTRYYIKEKETYNEISATEYEELLRKNNVSNSFITKITNSKKY